MAVFRAVAAAVVVVAFFVTASTISAYSLDICAQRVIRDWYSGGRVDGVYPLPCYRAAIRALPADVLQYSDADRDIASALAYARQKRRAESRAAAREAHAKVDTTTPAGAPRATPEAKPKREAASADTSRAGRPIAGSLPLASAAQPTAVESSVPYPVIALAALAGVLLLSGAAGWLARRRHRPGTTSDR
jgi:hypothetical protein